MQCRFVPVQLWYPQVFAELSTCVYAQCLEGRRGGATLLVINADRRRSLDLNLPTVSERYTLTAHQVEDTTVELNGRVLWLTSSGNLPRFEGEPVNAGRVCFSPASITYLRIANAGNVSCH
jgi:heparanase 1